MMSIHAAAGDAPGVTTASHFSLLPAKREPVAVERAMQMFGDDMDGLITPEMIEARRAELGQV